MGRGSPTCVGEGNASLETGFSRTSFLGACNLPLLPHLPATAHPSTADSADTRPLPAACDLPLLSHLPARPKHWHQAPPRTVAQHAMCTLLCKPRQLVADLIRDLCPFPPHICQVDRRLGWSLLPSPATATAGHLKRAALRLRGGLGGPGVRWVGNADSACPRWGDDGWGASPHFALGVASGADTHTIPCLLAACLLGPGCQCPSAAPASNALCVDGSQPTICVPPAFPGTGQTCQSHCGNNCVALCKAVRKRYR